MSVVFNLFFVLFVFVKKVSLFCYSINRNRYSFWKLKQIVGLLFSLAVLNLSYANKLLIESTLQEKQILELERILNSYYIQAERGILFKDTAPDPNLIVIKVLEPLSDSNKIVVKELEPIKTQEESSIEQTELEEALNQTFEDILEKEKQYLIEKEEFDNFLILYDFLQSFKTDFNTLRKLQNKISISFLNVNTAVSKNNKIDKKMIEIGERYKRMQDRKGNLLFTEIKQFIDFNMREKFFSANLSLKQAFDQTINYIRSTYDQIDLEKQRLLESGHPVAFILCDSSFYKLSQVNCLPIFELKDKTKMNFFINSLSPEKWQDLEIKTREKIKTLSYLDVSHFEDNLWQLAQESHFDKIHTLFRTTDFFRWLYFNLREELKSDPNSSFSWDVILEKLKKEQQEEENVILESITASMDENEINLEVTFYSNQMKEKEEDYFFALLETEDLINKGLSNLDIDLRETDISCLGSKLNSTSKWNSCIEAYFSFIVSQEDLKEEWEKKLNEEIKELVASASSLKKYLESQSN